MRRATMNPRPRVLCSIRDILVASSKPERIAEAHERVLGHYDAVLVHGDPELVPLDDSWPLDERIRPLIRYTGYVDENEAAIPESIRQGIVVSGGSSAASLPLYRAALAAAHRIADRPWRILVGRGVPEADFQALREGAPAHADRRAGTARFPRPARAERSFPSARPATTPSSICCAAACRRSSSPSRPVTRRSSACAPSA